MSEYVRECLREDEEFILYRARASAAEVPSVLLLTHASIRPRPESLKKIEHEYSLCHDFDPTWSVRPVALSECNGQKALVLEDPGGEFLHPLIQGPMEIRQFLRIAIGLSTALGQLHSRSVIHKDLKPSNVLVDAATGHAWLTGFGIATRLPRERQSPGPPEFIAGTLPYMAPEQTGRMNRSIDSRSDLYALGVTLYEMLTGSLPFTASEPMEWVHCHIARQPARPDVHLKGIPRVLSAIIMKLLEKNAEERYQTAIGVERDLRRCLDEWETQHRIDEFPLGEHDIPDRLLIPEKLYGRASEIKTLLASFDRVVARGRPELVLVSGYSGIGKSSVVNELHKPLVPPRGLFGSGKFDQYKRDIPYATLAQAFRNLIRPILAKSKEELGRWRDAIREALGPNGQLIVDLVPELKHIIGEQQPVPELPQQEAQGRFQLVFRRFISVFTREQPLALFLDDLQWLDAATLNLMEDLLAHPDVKYLMLIGAYRNNEVGPGHPLTRKLEAIRQTGALVHEIVLAPLTPEDLKGLIADSLHCEPERGALLGRLIHEKTDGNPFFAIQFISALAEQGLLTFNHSEASWSWDLNQIHAKGYTDNVVELMVGKLNRLPIETQKALQSFACLGNSAENSALSIVHGKLEDEVHADLWEALRLELIVRMEGSYKFVHDRVQEAAYSLIPKELRAETHLRIGRLLEAQISPDKREEMIFEIAGQLNRGTALITSREKREALAELNLMAGKRAKTSTAYASALNYLIVGAALLSDDRWERRHELAFALELNRAECEFLTGELAAAEERLAALSSRAANTLEQATVACMLVDVYTALDKPDWAVAVCLDYLRRLGVEWSPHPTAEQAQREYEQIWSQLGHRAIEELLELPLMSDPESLATLDVLTKVLPPAMITDANLVSLATCRAVNLSLTHGNSDGSCFAYVFLGMIAGPRFDNYKGGFQFGQLGYALVEKRSLHRHRARTYIAFGSFVMPWSRHVRASAELLRNTFEIADRMGDLTYAAYSCNNMNTRLLAAGDPLVEVQREAENGLGFAQKARFGLVIDIITSQLELIRTLRGLTPKFGFFDDEQFDELRFERHLATYPALALPECWYWIRKLQARVFAGDFPSAIEASLNAERLLWTSPSFFEVAEYHFYSALARAGAFDSATEDPRQRHFEALADHHRQLEIWAENCPENFENRAALVGAEIARVEGREFEAMRLYEQAIRSAHANGFVHNEALAYELAGRFYGARGFDKITDAYLREARYRYVRWGADGKVKQLDRLYPHIKQEQPPPAPTSTIVAPTELLDLATVIKVSQAASGEMVLEKLIDRIMRAAIEHAGAERGLLILPRGDELQIEAEVTTSGNDVSVHQGNASVAAAVLPESVVRYVMRTREDVILGDAAAENPFSSDAYIVQHRLRSILCLPLINQTRLSGILYLENKLALHVFTPDRITVLRVLASQAAVSLENTRLHRDLEDREARIRRLVDADILGIFIWNLDGAIVGANDAFLRIVQYEREDLVSGRVRWTDLTPAEWRERDERALAELKTTGRVQPFEKEYFRKDGARVPVLIGAAFFKENGNEGVAFVLDLSEQKRAEETLRKREAYLAESERLAHTGSWALDGTTREAQYYSEEMFRIFGFDPQQGLPKREQWLQRMHPEDRDKVRREASDRMFLQKVDTDIEYRIVLPDGTVKHIRGRAHPVLSPDGELVEVLGTVVDITERKDAEQARDRLRQLEADLAHIHRVTTMGELTASLAHEIKQPIGAAVTNAEACLRLLDRNQPDLPEAREAALEMVKDSRRAAAIIDRVRSLYQKGSPQRDVIDVNELIREMVIVLRNEANRHSITMRADLAERLPAVMGDRVQLQQALMNLMLNGIEAIRDPSGQLTIQSQLARDDQMLISVTDTGVGLPDEDIDKIFHAFFTTKSQGTGLGLAITRSIVESHGGRVWAAPNSGQGATFYFTLPSGGSGMTSPAD